MDPSKEQPQAMKDLEDQTQPEIEIQLSPSPSADSMLSSVASNNYDMETLKKDEIGSHLSLSPSLSADSKSYAEASNDIEALILDQLAVNRVYEIMDRFGFDQAVNHVYQTMERFGIEHFVFVMIPKDGKPLTGASDNLRESWEKYVSDNPDPPLQLEQFLSRQLAGVPSEVQGSSHSVIKDRNSGDVGGSSNVFQDPQGTS